jgi:MoaD family protein
MVAKVKITIPSLLSKVTNGEREVEVSATTLSEALRKLTARYGDPFEERVFDSTGRPKGLLNFYVNGKNAHFLKGLETQLKDGDEILILPAVGGG